MLESVPFSVRTFGWRSALRPAFVAASAAWAVLLLLAPFVASRPHASQAGTALVVAAYGIGSLLCHQLPERSYRVWSAQMPVCARCAGIYFGAAIAALVTVRAARGFQPSEGRLTAASGVSASPRSSPDSRRAEGERLALRWRSLREPRLALAVAALPTVATLLYEWSSGRMPAHEIRAAAGAPIGAVVAWLVVHHAGPERDAHPSTH
jgi:hypothetical protein